MSEGALRRKSRSGWAFPRTSQQKKKKKKTTTVSILDDIENKNKI